MRAVAAVLVAAVAAGCSAGITADESTGGYVSSDGAITVIPEAEREPAPEVSGVTLEGDQVALADHKGATVVVNVWGSWCGECRAEADDLVEVDERLGEDVRFLGINIRDNEDAARSYQRTYRIGYPSVFDPTSSQLLRFPPELAPVAVPTTYVIDPEGRVAARILSDTTASTLAGVIADVQGSRASG
jgi:thiol-disulfide isomerase/thioredoxin